MKINKNNFQLLNDFEAGQIEVIKWAKANLMRQIAEIENKDAGYLLRDTNKDALYCLKLLLQRNIWKFMLEQFEEKELEITQNHED